MPRLTNDTAMTSDEFDRLFASGEPTCAVTPIPPICVAVDQRTTFTGNLMAAKGN